VSDDYAKTLKDAEQKIQRILLNLAEKVGKQIDRVDIDTRNFANYKTEIFFPDE
jgi:hypothetical protein